MRKQIISIFFLLVLVNINASNIQNAADDEFKEFLDSIMASYSDYLKEHLLDPSNIFSETYWVSSTPSLEAPVRMTCDVYNQYIVGHSGVAFSTNNSESNFESHYFRVGRVYKQPHYIHGEYNCSGRLNHLQYPELEEDLPFSGQGNFSLCISSVSESITIHNLGITEADENGQKFNLTHSWPTLRISVEEWNDTNLIGSWNEELVQGNYVDDVTEAFAIGYFLRSLIIDTNIPHPNGQLMNNYVTKVAEYVNLKDILSPDNLPPPYISTPRE